MLIDTRTKEKMISSLADCFEISEDKLFRYINTAAEKAAIGYMGSLNIDDFSDELVRLFKDICEIDELYLYHLTRRLNNFDGDITCNLKTILTHNSAISEFLASHEVTFRECNGYLELFYKKEKVDLTDLGNSNISYLRSRLGYNNWCKDYCINGFLLKDQLMYNSYARELYYCPEIISRLSLFLKNANLQRSYFLNSKYYCLTYKLKTKDVIIDKKSNCTDKEKTQYFICYICLRLLEYYKGTAAGYDHNNVIIRTKDDECLSNAFLVETQAITPEMLGLNTTY